MTVSIILPTYNREGFLPAAFDSIRNQTFQDWELIVVDDGSTDNTAQLVEELCGQVPQACRYIYRENGGAYAARNTGLDHASAKYIAFYDSDDRWLPHHLKDCVKSLEENHDVDWVYGPSQRILAATGEVYEESTFYENEVPRPHLAMKVERRGDLHVITDDKATAVAIESGLCSPLQNSVIRAEVFDGFRFNSSRRNGGDQIMVVKCLKRGKVFAYLKNIQLLYTIHDDNSSAVGECVDSLKQQRVLTSLIEGLEELHAEDGWSLYEKIALRKRINRLSFWTLGYATLWRSGRRSDAFSPFRQGLSYWLWDWRCWKTYFLCGLRNLVWRGRSA